MSSSSSDRSPDKNANGPTFLPVLAGLTASGLPLIQNLSCASLKDINSGREEEKKGEEERTFILFGGLTANGLPLVQNLTYSREHILSPPEVFELEKEEFIESIEVAPSQTLIETKSSEQPIPEIVVVKETPEPVDLTETQEKSVPENEEFEQKPTEALSEREKPRIFEENSEPNEEIFIECVEVPINLAPEPEPKKPEFPKTKLEEIRPQIQKPFDRLVQLENELTSQTTSLTETNTQKSINGHKNSHTHPSDDVFLANFLRKLAQIKMSDEEKYLSVVERLHQLEDELKIHSSELPPDPEFTDLVGKILKSDYPNADLQIIVNSSRKTTTTKSFYETETPGMVGLNGDQIHELQTKLMGNISSPENAANQPDTTVPSDAVQRKEVVEEGYSAPDGSEVVSKKMTRVVTTSQSTVSGLDEHPEAARGAELIRLKVNRQMYDGNMDCGRIRLIPVTLVPAARPFS